MNKNIHKPGLIVAISIPLFVLPARISEGQWKDPVNLIGSEIVIFLMSLTCWYGINYILDRKKNWQGFVLALLCCCVLSNVFYFTFNPIFKDFPFRTAQNPLFIKILMLSSRGILMSIILIPAAYYVKRDREARHQRKENERLAMEKVKIENRLLEQAVVERTRALQQVLSSLEKSQGDLEHQLYIQSRLIASITHDVSGPFNFLLLISKEICELSAARNYEKIDLYSVELYKSLEKMSGFIKNLLEFTKLPVHQKLGKLEEVNLTELIEQKSKLFEGLIKTNHNELSITINSSLSVTSNANLLGIILHNLIDNANKHTRKGKIRISAFVHQSVPQISIENTGNGVPDEVLQWLNSNTETNSENQQQTLIETRGIGLILVKEITSILGMKIRMESDTAATKVYLSF